MPMQNPFPFPLIVDTDPEDSGCFSVWCDNGQGSSAEIAGRIYDEIYANYIVRAVNSHQALVETLQWIVGQSVSSEQAKLLQARARIALQLAKESK